MNRDQYMQKRNWLRGEVQVPGAPAPLADAAASGAIALPAAVAYTAAAAPGAERRRDLATMLPGAAGGHYV